MMGSVKSVKSDKSDKSDKSEKIKSFTEGYWASDQDISKDEYKGEYPWPVSSTSFPEKEIFVNQLIEVETRLLELEEKSKANGEHEKYVHSYRGLSMCRICNKKNGYKEYVLEISDRIVNWPEGFRHYVEVHDVRPTDEFLETIRLFYS